MGDVGTFSPWRHWNQRSALAERDGPGVYLLGRFEDELPAAADPGDERVLLIAETHDQTLAGRWNQFHRSAFNGAYGHSGGLTFHRLFANGPDSVVPAWLYVAARSVPDGADVQQYVQELKDRLLAEYEERWGVRPRCNTKGPAGTELAAQPTGVMDGTSVAHQRAAGEVIEPQICFSAWRPWAERAQIEDGEFSGVYALARFDKDPPAPADVSDERIVYIGETCENSLVGRLWQFNRSAFFGKAGHSGGWTYRARFADAGETLYVATFPVDGLAEPHRSAFIRLAERKLLWDYVRRWGRRPVCNSK